MKLYFAKNSRAERTAWLLEELGLSYDLQVFRLGEKAMRSESYRSINPMGRVPTLEDGDVTISESTAIAQYLVARYGNGRLAPATDSREFPHYLQWLHYAEGMMMPQLNIIVVETQFLPQERRSEEHENRARKLLDRSLLPLDEHLDGREWLAGEFSAADTITGHAAYISRKLGADLSALPSLDAYVERCLARPALQKALSIGNGE